MKKWNLFCVFGLVLFLNLSQGLFAQVSSTILGTVRDPSGALIPGVEVTTTNVETGITRNQLTDEAGRYRIGELQPGNYRINVELAGFRRETRTDIQTRVGQELILNFTLQVGALEQEVLVTGEAPLVETNTTAVASSVSQTQLQELPLNGRSFTDLVTLDTTAATPTHAGTATQFSLSPQLTIAGGRPDANSYMLDGTDMGGATSGNPGSAARVQLGAETVREFQVITANPKAEYGRSSGAVVNAITRSGTNEFHGSIFEYLRNNKLDARNFFDVKGLPPFKRNQFGGSLGGPIKQDKTFFFGAYEGFRQRQTLTNIYQVPTLAARQGIGILNPGETVDPRVRPYINLYPAPNGATLAGGVAEYITTHKNKTDENYAAGRIDHHLSDNDQLFGRFTISRAEAIEPKFDDSITNLETENTYVTLQWDRIFSPTLLNTLRTGFNRSKLFSDNTGMPNTQGLEFVKGQKMGAIGASGISSIGGGGATSGGALLLHIKNSLEIEDALSYTTGPHTMKFGALVQGLQFNTDQQNNQRGSISFNSLRNFLLAGPTGTSAGLVLPGSSTMRYLRSNLYAFYGQDDYRITSNFMLNFGLRWEFTDGLREKFNNIYYLRNGWERSTFNDLVAGELWKNHIKNFQPRLGFNWGLDDSQRTVLSGGFGIFHNQLLNNTMVSSRAQLPIYFRGAVSNVNSQPFFPNIEAVIRDSRLFRETRHFDYENFLAPTIYRYNLSVQRELPGEMALRLSYVGSTSRHLARRTAVNDVPYPIKQANGSWFFPPSTVTPQFVNPNFDGIQLMRSDVNGFYNGMTVNLQKRFSGGFSFNAGYTWSKSIDDASQSESNFASSAANGQYDDDRTMNRGLSDYDIPRVFVFNTVYELPLGPGHSLLNSGVAGAILGGWHVAGILRMQDGVPFTPRSSASYPNYQFIAARPNLKPGVDVKTLTQGSFGTREKWFDLSAFSVAAAGTPGTAGRNILRGPSLQTVDLTFGKRIRLREDMDLQFRGEFYNLFNHTNFGLPGQSVFSRVNPTTGEETLNPTAGRITNTATPARQVQLALRLTF